MSSALIKSAGLTVGFSVYLHRQKGLSLVEMMISLVVGLILMAAVFNMYTGNVRSARFTEGVQALQENGRYAVSVLQRGLQLAGYSPVVGAQGEIEALDISESGASALTIRTRQAFDCNGLSTSATDGLAVNSYKLNNETQELTCKGNQAGSTDMVIVEGIDAFQVLYGIDDDDDITTCEPAQYVRYANTIESSDVVALRYAFLVNSGAAIRSRNESKTFVVLNNEITTMEDRTVREVFSGTVLLRNNISCTNL